MPRQAWPLPSAITDAIAWNTEFPGNLSGELLVCIQQQQGLSLKFRGEPSSMAHAARLDGYCAS
jgi:hypothetical protein